MRNLRLYVRRALELPPRVAARKAAGLLVRVARSRLQRLRDRARSSYGPPIPGVPGLVLAIRPEAIGETEREALAALAGTALRHRFDILGSGLVDVGHGASASGIEGVRYQSPAEARRIAETGTPWQLVAPASRVRSRQIYRLIDDAGYRPIDWQRDMRSGFRWSERTPWQQLRIGTDRGADIKMPWELSRMQHLPQLALAAVLARSGDGRFAAAESYVREIRNQILDFIAANPPRHGACWGCPMDVGIRAANWVLASAIVQGAGIAWDKPFAAELLGALRDACVFIAGNLEWAETGRSNHYLSDLVGLLFAATALPRTPETATWANFAARELLSETLVQFHADGGNFEGSTSYHRLSADIVAYGVALTAGLAAREPQLFGAADAATLAAIRVRMPPTATPIDHLLSQASERLGAILAFTRAIRRPDGDIVQIGDTDSGRLFKLGPALDAASTALDPIELHLRVDDLIQALEALADAAPPAGAAGAIVAALSGGRRLGSALPSRVPASPWQVGSSRVLESLAKDIARLPAASRAEWRIALPAPVAGTPAVAAFADFGLYCLTAPDLFLAFRAAAHARTDAPSGHTHDDNLGIELIAGGKSLIVDPGTYVYTSFPEFRNAYRAAAAHHVPRSPQMPVVEIGQFLFQLRHLMTARCLAAGPGGFAGILQGPAGRIMRTVEVGRDVILVRDGVEGGTLTSVAPTVPVAIGYGKKTTRPAAVV